MNIYNKVEEIYSAQQNFFKKGDCKNITFRIDALKKLKNMVLSNQDKIIDAMQIDSKKPIAECYMSEIGMVIGEINYALKNIKKWTKKTKEGSPIILFGSKSYILKEPVGLTLVISPWNYPLQLALSPVVGAIAAGNCCILKPSELTPKTSHLIKLLVNSTFEEEYFAVIEGGELESNVLLKKYFDKIFFTGSPHVGKIVMKHAADTLSPVLLELGGKSPCIVDKKADLNIAAKRIVFGKYMNAGQTCIAPDYLLVHKESEEDFYNYLKKWIVTFYSKSPELSQDYGRIINQKHFNRLTNYLNDGKIVFGGNYNVDDLYIEPTVLKLKNLNCTIMEEEIFGPILPVIVFENIDEIEAVTQKNPNPLALYVFSDNQDFCNYFIDNISFGGGCINDTISQILNPKIPFGGKGNSGMGHYHGKYSFEAFSHFKSVVKSTSKIDIPLKYPPYKNKLELIKKYMLR